MTRKAKPESEAVDPGAGRWRPGLADVARVLAAVAVAVGVLVGGIVGVDAGLSSDNDDDVWAALFLGACGLFIGAAVFVVLRKSARRWSRELMDVDGVTAVGLAQMHGAADMDAVGHDGGE